MLPDPSASTPLRASPVTLLQKRHAARSILARLALVALGAMSLFGLGGCQAVEAIFKVGLWFGVLIVVAFVAIVGGIAAVVMKRK